MRDKGGWRAHCAHCGVCAVKRRCAHGGRQLCPEPRPSRGHARRAGHSQGNTCCTTGRKATCSTAICKHVRGTALSPCRCAGTRQTTSQPSRPWALISQSRPSVEVEVAQKMRCPSVLLLGLACFGVVGAAPTYSVGVVSVDDQPLLSFVQVRWHARLCCFPGRTIPLACQLRLYATPPPLPPSPAPPLRLTRRNSPRGLVGHPPVLFSPALVLHVECSQGCAC